jgi:hypothetical protein
MKVALLGCAFLFSQIGLSQMHYPSSVTLHDYELKGPVKELIFDDNCPDTNDISYGGMYTNSPTDLGCHAILSFNKFGYLTQKSIKRHGNWISQTQFTFLQDSILTSLKGNEGFPHDEILFKYNDAGEILTIEIMYQSKLYAIYRFDRNQEARTLLISHLLIDEKKTIIIEKELQEFDSNLNLLSSKKFKGKSETPHFVRTFTYNHSNQLASESTWRIEPSVTKKDQPKIDYWQICYTYNNSGNVIEETEYIGIEKQIYTQTKYFYNQYHFVAERRDTNFMYSRQSIISYEYDTLKQLKLETHTSNGRLVRYFMYDYDVLGNRILELEEKSAPVWSDKKVLPTNVWHVTTRNQYEYDHYGNWTKKYYLDWDGNEKIATRTISYWE